MNTQDLLHDLVPFGLAPIDSYRIYARKIRELLVSEVGKSYSKWLISGEVVVAKSTSDKLIKPVRCGYSHHFIFYKK